MSKLTLSDVRDSMRRRNMVVAKRDGEYRVDVRGAGPLSRTAYFTDDLADAFRTGVDMAYRSANPSAGTRSHHRALYPDQYAHELVGAIVRLHDATEPLRLVTRVLTTRWGQLAELDYDSRVAFPIERLIVVAGRTA